MANGDAIDFVIPWVDGSDPEWLKEKAYYTGSTLGIEDGAARYRDWGLLKYWFRGVEEFAPWVRRIHFITWGHIPSWLNVNHPKLNIVRHEDYIPHEFLPTFSANTIELNLHRIDDLVDHFVYFNDDMFLTKHVEPGDFFKKGKPKLSAVGTPLKVGYGDWFFMPIVDNAVINRHFAFHDCIRKHPFKWINIKYGVNTIRTLTVLPYPYFCGIMEFHLPNPFTRQSFEEVWDAERELLEETCSHRTRNTLDVNQYLVKNWAIAKGDFEPLDTSFGRAFQFRGNSNQTIDELRRYISKGKGKVVCINDSAMIDDIEGTISSCREIFEQLLPLRSSYEIS